MLVLVSVLLLSSYVLPLIQSQTCNETTEYLKDNRCCRKCKPGESMEKRCKEGSHDTVCEPCSDGYYMDVFNENHLWCKNCKMCTKEHMKYKEQCTPTRDAVCTCDEGYRCSDSTCKMCVTIHTTTTSPPPTPTKTPPHIQNMKYKKCTAISDGVCACDEGYRCRDSTCQMCVKVQTTTTFPSPAPIKTPPHIQNMKYKKCTPISDGVCACDEGYRCWDSTCQMCVKVQMTTVFPSPAPTKTPPHTQNNVWISVSLCFACVCVCVLFTCFLLISRHERLFGWIMSVSADFLLSKKRHSSSSENTEEEEIPMPVQEVCGKGEKLEDD